MRAAQDLRRAADLKAVRFVETNRLVKIPPLSKSRNHSDEAICLFGSPIDEGTANLFGLLIGDANQANRMVEKSTLIRDSPWPRTKRIEGSKGQVKNN